MAIKLKNVWYRYPGSRNWVLKGISIGFSREEACAVVGPNASGKTTMLKIVSLLYKPTRGEVEAWNTKYWDLPPSKALMLRRRVVYVHEKPILLRGTVAYNIGYGLILRGHSIDEAKQRARAILDSLGLSYLADKEAKSLSAGEAQLTAILRAIVIKPDIVVLDEPISHLDRSKRRILVQLLARMKRKGIGLVIATHDLILAETLADRIIYLERGAIVGVERK